MLLSCYGRVMELLSLGETYNVPMPAFFKQNIGTSFSRDVTEQGSSLLF